MSRHRRRFRKRILVHYAPGVECSGWLLALVAHRVQSKPMRGAIVYLLSLLIGLAAAAGLAWLVMRTLRQGRMWRWRSCCWWPQAGVARAPAGFAASSDPLWRPAAGAPGCVPTGVLDWSGAGAGRALDSGRSVGCDLAARRPGAGGAAGVARTNMASVEPGSLAAAKG